MDIQTAMQRQGKHVRWQELAKRGDDDQVGGEIAQQPQCLWFAQRPRLIHGDIVIERELFDRREGHMPPTSHRFIWPGDDASHR